MGVINGKQFIDRLNNLETEIWMDGQKLTGLKSEHPAFKGMLQTKALLFDLQQDPDFKEEMTFVDPKFNEDIGLSFLRPKVKEDLIKRRKMMEHWAKLTNGMMGRTPDYLNSVIMSFAAYAPSLQGKVNCFPENIMNLYELAKKNDLTFTHTFITPQVNRSLYYFRTSQDPVTATVIDTNDRGIIIKGARLLATQGGLTDEVLVFSIPNFNIDENEAFAFSIPSDTKGIKFICRDSFVGGSSSFDHPLSCRYEEMDSIVVFDHVLVPWNRVFFYGNIEASANFIRKCPFNCFALFQAVNRQIIKLEFMLGLAETIVDTINVSEYLHIHEKMSEIIIGLETMKALLDRAENEAEVDEYGTLRPNSLPLQVASNIFPKIYPRFCEIIQLIGASGLVSLPTENAFNSENRHDLDHYLQGATKTAEERVKIFRLAWDLTMSPFGTRQTQYERYFFGDPVRLSSTLYKTYKSDQYVKTVLDFLNITKDGITPEG
ncbi:4-hydroxyphenylacetate 3-monooxygenase, oxygenase component [Chungangia koreensis]|uniref:4-hydroxyphenylacetate 3-monooxygenase, oxygenase component n=1 Tax=Chungangia koreensis TaxID=752657 RepID=A0ABV8X5S4_9LACT